MRRLRLRAADFNTDERLNAVDCLLIKRTVLGLGLEKLIPRRTTDKKILRRVTLWIYV